MSAQRVAEAMGVSRSRVAALEGSARPSPEAVSRYVAALQLAVAVADSEA